MAVLAFASLFAACRSDPTSRASSPHAFDRNALDAEIRAFREQRALPGLSVAVLAGSEVVFAEGYGFANVERSVPVGEDTLFPIGSIEKEFTAAAVLRLVEQGRLQLDDAITDLLPELDTGGYRVTIRHMLQQTSGLQDWNTLDVFRSHAATEAPAVVAPRAARIRSGEGFTPGEDVALFAGAPLYHPPGERWTYSQPNYDLLCFVIAELSGETYYEASGELAARAAIPFHAAWTPTPPPERATTAQGYRASDGEARPFNEENTGSAWTTAAGLVRWAKALDAGAILSPRSYELMTTPVTLNDGRTWPYGMGVVVDAFEGHRILAHTGNLSGFTAVLVDFPDDELAIAVVANLGYTLAPFALAQRIARRWLDLPDPAYLDLPLDRTERARYAGEYHAGPLDFDLLPSGDRLTLVLRDAAEAACRSIRPRRLRLDFSDFVAEPEPVLDGAGTPPPAASGPAPRHRTPDEASTNDDSDRLLDPDSAALFRFPLAYQGDGRFVALEAPDVVQLAFDAPNELSATFTRPGWRAQALRTP